MSVITEKLIPLHDKVFVTDMEFGEQITKAGIVLRSDDGKSEGIKPRWGRVWAIGPDQKDVSVGEWVLIEHGRWTRGMKVLDESGKVITVRMVENKAIMVASDEKPSDAYVGEINNASTTASYDFSKPMY